MRAVATPLGARCPAVCPVRVGGGSDCIGRMRTRCGCLGTGGSCGTAARARCGTGLMGAGADASRSHRTCGTWQHAALM
eukprot:3109755-Amphidinium_carterae.1